LMPQRPRSQFQQLQFRQLPLPSPYGQHARVKMVFAALVERLQCDMEGLAVGLPKPTQMESLATIVFLVTLPMVF